MYSTLKNSWEVKQDIYEAFCTEMDKEDSANDDRLDYLQDQLSIASGKFSEYVDIAVRLKSDRGFYQQMVGLIAERKDLIWADMTVPFTWSNLLSGIIGVRALEWEEFLAQTGRDVALEKQRTLARERNAALFQQRWGKEAWLLQNGVAELETMLDSADQQPCIFLDWNCAD